MMKNYYKILGIDKKAKQEDIKRAYREKSKIYHPDATGNKQDQAKFIELQEAYETLANTEKRKKYDEQLDRLTQEEINIFDRELAFRMILSPAEAYYGARFHIYIPFRKPCPRCRSWTDPFCPVCGGYGLVIEEYPISVNIPSGVRNGATIRIPLKFKGLGKICLNIKVVISPNLTTYL